MSCPQTRPFAIFALLAGFLACGGGSSSGSSLQAPTALSYSSNAPVYTQGVAIAPNVLSHGGGAVSTCSVVPSLPAGLAFSVYTGTITGTPTSVSPAANYSVTASNAAGSATTVLSITVKAPAGPMITTFSPTLFSAGYVVTITGQHLTGATRVQFNGVDASYLAVVSDTELQAWAPEGLTAGTLRVTTPGGTAVSSTVYAVGVPIDQAMLNGDFEATNPPLIWQGDTGTIQPALASGNPEVAPHGGTQFAWLGGYGAVASDQITQDIYVPTAALSAKITFYMKILTEEPGTSVADTVTISALDTTGAPLGVPQILSNLDAGGYTRHTMDLMAYKGRIIRLSFKSQEDAQNATSFLLDDVAFELGFAALADFQTVILGFTPTTGLPGETTVQITGGNFSWGMGLGIGGTGTSYTLIDATHISATVPNGAPFGSAPITIHTPLGDSSSSTNFSVVYGTPTVSGVNPTQGPVGTPVVIAGTYLGYWGTRISLNGQPIDVLNQVASQLAFIVPAGASSGDLVVTTPGGSITRTFTVNAANTTLDLHIEKIQLTQSIQTLDNAVPIVAGKAGLVRVFALANQSNAATPAVQITLMNNGLPVSGFPKTVAAPGASVPTTLNESEFLNSWNLLIPATDLTTPTGTGYSIQATVDPASTIAESDETNNTATVALSGTTVPAFKTKIFPVALSSGRGNISSTNQATWVARLAKMYPVAGVDVVIGSTFTGSISTLGSNGAGWETLLNDLATKHQADAATDRYYFGAVNVGYSSGVAGLGYIPNSPSSSFASRTAIGWDKEGYSDGGNFPEVFAHETGHNMGRQHSPCPTSGSNVPAGIDPAYPYAEGLIGVWGYDSVLNQLESPVTTKDIMAYCSPNWVSDYTYKGILAFRGGSGGFMVVGAEDSPSPKVPNASRECLLVRGIVHEDGKVEFLPSFQTQAHPTPLVAAGEYTLEGLDQQGTSLFAVPLDLMELGCSPNGHMRHFVMALPLEPSVLGALAGLNIIKGKQILSSVRSLPGSLPVETAKPDIHRLGESRVQITWDATLHRAMLVRDADSGEVIAILSGGQQTISTKGRRFELTLSDGVRGATHRLEIPD